MCFQLSKHFNLGKTKAAEHAGEMVGQSDKSVREWRKKFLEEGEVPESKQGKYQRSGVLWSDEALNRKAARHIHENASVKGQPNLTVSQFCQWVNDDLLPNETLEPGFFRKISIETAQSGWSELGFSVVRKKGTYVDGHEREDVIDYRKTFLRRYSSHDGSTTDESLKRQKMQVVDAAREAVSIRGYNERTVQKYRDEFFSNKGELEESKRGKYKRFRIYHDEEINHKAAAWVRKHAFQKGAPKRTLSVSGSTMIC